LKTLKVSDSENPLSDLNFPQYWAAVVSQFNATLQIKQEQQRKLYEEKFDSIRDEAKAKVDELKLKQAELVDLYCGLFDDLNTKTEQKESLQVEVTALHDDLKKAADKNAKLNELHKQLLDEEKSKEKDIVAEEARLHRELTDLKKQKAEMREQINDLKMSLKMKKKLQQCQVDPKSIIFTKKK
jgi:chromosome segregation ATPase